MRFPPRKSARRRRHRAARGPMPYRYDRRRPAWVPLSLIANGILLSWLGSSLVQPDLYHQRGVQAFPLRNASATSSLGTHNSEANGMATQLASNVDGELDVRLTYDQWVKQLEQEAKAIALQNISNISILAGDSLSLWFPEDLLPHDQRWLNQGISGETSQGLIRRLGLWQDLNPNRIFVMIGINDLLKGTKAETVLNNQRTIVRNLRKAHPKTAIIVQSVLPHSGPAATWEGRAKLSRIPNDEILRINRQLAAIAKAEGAYYLDLNPLFRNQQGYLRPELTTDGLHLNPQGYLVWSTAMNFFSLQELEDRTSTTATTTGPTLSSPLPSTIQTSQAAPSTATTKSRS